MNVLSFSYPLYEKIFLKKTNLLFSTKKRKKKKEKRKKKIHTPNHSWSLHLVLTCICDRLTRKTQVSQIIQICKFLHKTTKQGKSMNKTTGFSSSFKHYKQGFIHGSIFNRKLEIKLSWFMKFNSHG